MSSSSVSVAACSPPKISVSLGYKDSFYFFISVNSMKKMRNRRKEKEKKVGRKNGIKNPIKQLYLSASKGQGTG